MARLPSLFAVETFRKLFSRKIAIYLVHVAFLLYKPFTSTRIRDCILTKRDKTKRDNVDEANDFCVFQICTCDTIPGLRYRASLSVENRKMRMYTKCFIYRTIN